MSVSRLAVKAVAAIALAGACHFPLLAQDACRPSETVGACWSHLFDPNSEINNRKNEAAAATWQQLAGKATGLNTATAPSSAIQDFLPLLRMALVGNGQPSGSDLKALDFEHQVPLPVGSPLELKLNGSRNDPDIYDPLKMKFAAAVRDQQVAKLKGQLGDFDDYSVTLSGNVVTGGYGRTWKKGGPVFGTLFSQMVGGATELKNKAGIEFNRVLRTVPNVDESTPINTIPEPTQTELQLALGRAAQELQGSIAGLKTLAEQFAIFKVADLVNNQPQINGSAAYRARRGLAGPTELSLKASYEMGFVNLNQMLSKCVKDPAGNLDDLELACYAGYVNDPATAAALERGDRAAFSIEYKDRRAFRASLPADGIDLDLPSGRSLVASLTYGRYLDVKALGNSNSRIDLSGSYENVSDDPMRKDRGVVSLTYSNRFLQALGTSLGVSYANHSEFLSKTDHVLSAHFALSYKLLSDTPPSTGN